MIIKWVDEKRLYSHGIIIFIYIIAIVLLYLNQPAIGTVSDPDYKIVKLDDNTTTISIEDNDQNTNSNENFAIDVPTIISALTAASGIATILFGIKTYKQTSQKNIEELKLNRLKEVMIPLINEYDKPGKMDWAKQILDEKDLGPHHPTEDYPYGFYTEERLLHSLMDHKKRTESWDKGDGIVRSSFDTLLNFFVKLEYLRSIGLLTYNDLNFFHHIIDKAANNKAVVNYAKRYNFPLKGILHNKLSWDIPSNWSTKFRTSNNNAFCSSTPAKWLSNEITSNLSEWNLNMFINKI